MSVGYIPIETPGLDLQWELISNDLRMRCTFYLVKSFSSTESLKNNGRHKHRWLVNIQNTTLIENESESRENGANPFFHVQRVTIGFEHC